MVIAICDGCGAEIDLTTRKWGDITSMTIRPLGANRKTIERKCNLLLCAGCYWNYIEPLNELYEARESAIEDNEKRALRARL